MPIYFLLKFTTRILGAFTWYNKVTPNREDEMLEWWEKITTYFKMTETAEWRNKVIA